MPESGSGYGIRTLALLIRDDIPTREELSRAMGLTPEQLETRLALMERQGYLAGEQSGRRREGCLACRCCTTCRGTGNTVTRYELTEKGLRLAGSASRDMSRINEPVE